MASAQAIAAMGSTRSHQAVYSCAMFGLFGKPSRSKFAKLVMGAARQAGLTGLSFDEPNFTILRAESRLYLGNIYDEYCNADRAKQQILINNAIEIMRQSDASFSREDALDQVVAVLRERAMFAFLDLQRSIQGHEALSVPSEAIGDWFMRTLVLDAPGSMRMVTEKDLQEWDLTFDELFDIGLERLRGSCEPKFREEDGYFIGTWNDDYDSSRVLVPTLFEDLPIEGSPVICIPNRLALMVADSAKPAAARAMLAKAEQIVQSAPRPQNPSPLTYRDGELVDFCVPPGSELSDAVQRARGLSAILYYDEQKQLLEALHEKTGKDVYVGKFTFNQRPDGSYVSWCSWAKGIPTLLPKSDLIIFGDPESGGETKILAIVPWDDAQAVVGDLMLDAEMFPPRFYVSKFPTEEQFAKMPKVEM